MNLSRYIIYILSVLTISCGGGGSDNKSSAPIVEKNISPVIASAIIIEDSSANGVIETLEPFIVLLNIIDSDNDPITGDITIDDHIVGLVVYQGDKKFTHQASFSIATKGEKIALIRVSDGVNADVILNYQVAVVPSKTEVQEVLASDVVNFVFGGEIDGLDLLGSSTDELYRTVGYLSAELTEENLKYNVQPSGECGVNRPHKLLKVDVTATETTIPEPGLIFPLECLSTSQQNKIEQRQKKLQSATINSEFSANYIAQHFIITKYDNDDMTISQIGSGITLEGDVGTVLCAELPLTKDVDRYVLTNSQIEQNITSLTAERNEFLLECQRTVNFNEEINSSPLLAIITGELIEVDSTFPAGSIDEVSFSIPYLDGGLDQGEICVSTTANDNIGIESEIVTLHAADGLTDSVVMVYQEDVQQYCAQLIGFDGQVYISQDITDFSENTTSNISESYVVEKNDAPVFSNSLADNVSLQAHQGIITLIKNDDVSDPENQTVTLTGQLQFDTDQALGNYEITATATDPYNAQSEKTIAIALTENIAPTAELELLGDYILIDDAIRDVNDSVTIALSSNDEDGSVVSSTLKMFLDYTNETEITNYSSTYNHNISQEGGHSRTFSYQVTDNEGAVSSLALLEFTIHQNQAPIYTGKTEYSTERGKCIAIEQEASDSEGDQINFSIEGNNWQLCSDSVSDLEKLVTISDNYSKSSSTSVKASFLECSEGSFWDGNDCVEIDINPDAFSFESADWVGLNTWINSDNIVISGINSETSISIEGGEYSRDRNNFTASSGVVTNGEVINVRVLSSENQETTTTATLYIGDKSASYSVTTLGPVPLIEIKANRNSLYAGDYVTIDGDFFDGDGTIVDISWSQEDGSVPVPINVDKENQRESNISFLAPNVINDENYTFRLTIEDNDGNSAYDEVNIEVKPSRPENVVPTVNAGQDQTVNSGETVYLSGTASDVDGTVESYGWGQYTTTIVATGEYTSGPNAGLENRSASSTSFIAPDVTEAIILMFHLQATDNEGGQNEGPNLGSTPASGPSDDIIYITVQP